MAEKNQARGLPPPPAFFHQISPVIYISCPRLPLQFHSLQFTLHSGGDNTYLASACLGCSERGAGSQSPQREGFPDAEMG